MRRRAPRFLAIALVLAMATTAVARTRHVAAAGVGPVARAAAVAPTLPNVLLLIADDQAWSTFDRSSMPNVFSQIADKGVLFDRAYANTSLCCPSRSTMFTGLETTDTGVANNNDALTRPTIVQALHDSGYRTALAGKYLNSWPCANTRPEFDEWYCYGHAGANQTNPKIDVNGRDVPFVGFSADIFANMVNRFIATTPADQPFFAVYSPKVPHLPTDDPRHETLPIPQYRPPSFDEDTLNTNKPHVVQRGPLTSREIATIDGNYGGMYRTSRSLDDDIGSILTALGPRADNTLVIYVSDKGFMYGEHRIADGKEVSYEPSVNTPLAIRDPQTRLVDNPLVSHALAQNTDIAATIAERTGIEWHSEGHSLTPIISGSVATIRDAALIERCISGSGRACAPNGQSRYFVGEVTDRYKYVRYFTGEIELYDLDNDPWELTNLAGTADASAVQAQLASRLADLRAPPDPDTTIVTGPHGTVGAVPLVFTYFSQSRNATYTCQLTGPGQSGQWSPCGNQTQTIAPLANGTYTFRVLGADETGATDTSPASRTFTVDRDLPAVSLVNTSMREGNPSQAQTQMQFAISLNAPTTHPVTVSYETDNGTALESSDYEARSGSLTIPVGHISKFVSVPLTRDLSFEDEETFALRLYAVTGGTLTTDEGTGKIRNDDAPPIVAVHAAAAVEGTGANGTLAFPVTVSPASGLPVLVHYQTSDGSAKVGVDYTAGRGTLMIPPGQTSAPITVSLVGDALNEADETLTTTLSAPVDARFGVASATGRIVNDDAAPVVSVGDTQVVEVDTGATSSALFTIRLSTASDHKVKVNYATTNGTATSPADYLAATGTATFAIGTIEKTIPITVVGDDKTEADETFRLTLLDPKGTTIGTATAIAEIVDDESAPPRPTVSVAGGPPVVEGDSATADAMFTISLSAASTDPVSVHYETADGTALSGSDYEATSGTVTIPGGTTSASVAIHLVGDAVYETDETFGLQIGEPINTDIGASSASVSIVDDDPVPTVGVADDFVVLEGNAGTTAPVHDSSLRGERARHQGEVRDHRSVSRRARRLHESHRNGDDPGRRDERDGVSTDRGRHHVGRQRAVRLPAHRRYERARQ